MGLLKQKIARALACIELQRKNINQVKAEPLVLTNQAVIVKAAPRQKVSAPKVKKTSQKPSKKANSSKKSKPRRNTIGNNIMKNYARAMVNFALSPMALSYLNRLIQSVPMTLNTFIEVLDGRKEKIHCIKSLREMLLIESHDSKQTAAFKKVFQGICEVFLKFFCVNWIYNSKVSDKTKHLKYRSKILRRVQSPQYFTYLEDFSEVKVQIKQKSDKDEVKSEESM